MKISFIICYSDESKLQEAIYYINRQDIPDGCEFDILPIYDAESYAKGYQFGMKTSDADYKVYLQEDVLLIRNDFLYLLIEVFNSDDRIGMFGFVGSDKFLENALYPLQWNLASLATYNGRRLQSRIIGRDHGQDKETYSLCDAVALDSLLLATRYDIDWDVNAGFGDFFFDIAQCVRMQSAGYTTVTVVADRPYILQDRASTALIGFDKDANTFCDKYSSYGYINNNVHIEHSMHVEKIKQLKEEFIAKEKDIRANSQNNSDIDCANELLTEIKAILVEDGLDPDLHMYLALLSVYGADEESMGYSNIWPAGDLDESISFFNNVKYLLWRSFFGAPEEDWSELVNAVSGGIISDKAVSAISKRVTGVEFK